jgi:hypothetical protein
VKAPFSPSKATDTVTLPAIGKFSVFIFLQHGSKGKTWRKTLRRSRSYTGLPESSTYHLGLRYATTPGLA